MLFDEARLSIIIPTYNRAKYLSNCLDSVIVQTNLPKEVIIVDDYSDDDSTFNIVKSRQDEFKDAGVSLKIIRNSRDKGIAPSRNVGIDISCGDIVLFIDDDIILNKNFIRCILKNYRERDDCLGVQGYIGDVRLNGLKNALASLLCIDHLEKNASRVLPSLHITYPYLLEKPIPCQWLTGGCQSYRRSVLDKFRFDENLLWYSWKEDLDLSYRINKQYPGSLFIDPSAKYSNMASDVGKPPTRKLIYMKQIYELYLFFKDIEQKPENKLIFLWSRIGLFMVQLMKSVLSPLNLNRKIPDLVYLAGAYVTCLLHKNEIRAGDLEFFNGSLPTIKMK